MKRHIQFSAYIIISILAAAFLGISCASEPDEIPTDLQAIEYFQKAQEAASEDNNYSLAIRYYNTFIDRHPEDIQKIIEAKYEIAFLHYKQGKHEQAKKEFNELLQNYEGDSANVLPAWPRVLAQKVLEKIEEGDEYQDVEPSSPEGSGGIEGGSEGGSDDGAQQPSMDL
ncbi:MAG: tetratricopeptide repeat protein [Sediminispirochaetaceae bacterium]